MAQTAYEMPTVTPPGRQPAGAGPRRRHRGIVGPVLLIGIGALLLLQNLGLLPWEAWTSLWRLWPLILVAIGAELLLRDRVNGLLLAVVVIGILVGGVALANALYFTGGRTGSAAFINQSFQAPLQGATRANVSVEFGAGELNVGSLATASPDQLGTMTFDGPGSFRPEQRLNTTGGVANLEFRVRGGDGGAGPFPFPFFPGSGPARMAVALATGVPLSLDVQTGASQATLDLSQLDVDRLTLRTGASTTQLRLPQGAGLTDAQISGGASTITIEVPPSVAADIRFQGGVSTLEVDQSRFPSLGGQHYRSANYDSATNRVDLTIDAGASTIRVL